MNNPGQEEETINAIQDKDVLAGLRDVITKKIRMIREENQNDPNIKRLNDIWLKTMIRNN